MVGSTLLFSDIVTTIGSQGRTTFIRIRMAFWVLPDSASDDAIWHMCGTKAVEEDYETTHTWLRCCQRDRYVSCSVAALLILYEILFRRCRWGCCNFGLCDLCTFVLCREWGIVIAETVGRS